MVRRESGLISLAKLTPNSIQEALRMYFQPIKNDDPHLDFYTMYKREATEYDTEYMKKYNEDLNTTLIFVMFCYLPDFRLVLTNSSGRSVLRSQFGFRHRCPVEARARCRRAVRSLPPRNPSQPRSIHRARRTPCSSPRMGRSSYRSRNNLGPTVCEPFDVAAGCIRRNVG